MKKLIIVLGISILLFGCKEEDKYIYKIELTYTDSSKEIIDIIGDKYSSFYLSESCLRKEKSGTLFCGVRNFKILIINKL